MVCAIRLMRTFRLKVGGNVMKTISDSKYFEFRFVMFSIFEQYLAFTFCHVLTFGK